MTKLETIGARSPSLAGKRRWSWSQYLAVAALPILFWESWTLFAWLGDGPSQISQYRDRHSGSWYTIQVLQAAAAILVVVVGFYVIRDCIRKRDLTFDAMLCLVGLTLFWSDVAANFFQPTNLFSSNFINLNNPEGFMPLKVNPDLARLPDPIPFLMALESVGFLAGAMLAGAIVRRIRRRRPEISNRRVFLLLMGFGVVLDLCFEVPIVALKVWSYPGAPFALPVGEGGYRLPVAELIAGGSVFGLVAALRIFKDDQGRTIVERGLSHLKPAKAKVVTLLALYAVMQMIVWGPGTMPDFLYQPYMVEWPKNYPTHLLNGACDAPGYRGTPYGPCPGSDGFQMPGRRVKLDR